MFIENGFHFGWSDGIALILDGFLYSVQDMEVAFFIHQGQVASVEPAVAERLTGIIGTVEVAFHHLRPPDYQFSGLPGRQLNAPALLVNDAGLSINDRYADGAGSYLSRRGVVGLGRRLT